MSARSGFDGVLLSSTDGLPLIGIDVTVYEADGVTEATVYNSKVAGSAVTFPIVTSSGNGGLIQFWAEPGYYEIEAVDNEEIPARITPRRIPFNAVAGDVSGIPDTQVDLASYYPRANLYTAQAYGTSTTTISSIPPGKYQGMLATQSTAKNGITVASGSATISNGLPVGAQIVPFILTVTTTASINFNPSTSSPTQITLIGFKD
jgi:hypothetical protein